MSQFLTTLFKKEEKLNNFFSCNSVKYHFYSLYRNNIILFLKEFLLPSFDHNEIFQ